MDDKENIGLKEISYLRDYISKHFEIQANQRLTLFRFYTAFIVLYLYGVGYLTTHLDPKSYHDEISGIVVSILFMFITYIFQSLDERNRDIIKTSRDAICYIETKYKYKDIPDNELEKVKIFNSDEAKKTKCTMTHTKCFSLIFKVGYGLSLLVIFMCLNRTGVFHYLS